jgi:hypothetical protein
MVGYPLENMWPWTQHQKGYNIDKLTRLQVHIEAFSEMSLEVLTNSFMTNTNASLRGKKNPLNQVALLSN